MRIARLAPLFIVVFAGFFGYSLMITVFTPLLMQPGSPLLPLGAPPSANTLVLGVLLFAYPFGQFIGSPIMGTLSDRFGRKPVLLGSLAATTCAYAAIATSVAGRSLPLLIVACAIAGLAEANVVTAQAAIADIVAPGERNRYFGYVYMSSSLAYVVGPLLGGKLADPAIVPWFNDALPFWCTCALLALVAVLTATSFAETKAASDVTAAPRNWMGGILALRSVVTNAALRRYFLVNATLYLAIFGFFRSYPMYLVGRFGFGVSRVSDFVAWVGVPIVIANLWLTGALSRRFALRPLTVWSAVLAGLSIASVAVVARPAGLWPTLFLAGLFVALVLPGCATLLSNAAPQSEQGTVMGDNQAVLVAAEALSGLVSGALAAAATGLPLATWGAVALAGAVLLALPRRDRSASALPSASP
jgi:DHA1 family tetracycline resistance protein-like MFS transporter